MKKFVFIDESIRDQYTMAAVIVPITKVKEYRREMLTLRAKGARSFHITKERLDRQKLAVRMLSSLTYCSFVYSSVSSQKTDLTARQMALSNLLRELEPGELHLILDRTTMEPFDRKTLFTERGKRLEPIEFVHLERHQDPGLWGADILAWSIRTKFQGNFFDGK